jgi:hypothetical protein
MNKLIFPLLNTITLLGTLFINYWSNTGALNGKNVGDISEKYSTLFTPADYAFSIWGFIYLLLIAFVAFQWYVYFSKKFTETLTQAGLWFSLANIANGVWVVVWLHEYTGLSVFVMLVLLLSLVAMVIRLNMERWDAPVRILAFVWWPICVYLGWIILATVTNIAAWLVSTGWQGGSFGETGWTLVMIGIATVIYIVLIFNRSMREASMVGIWGLVAIAVKQWELNASIAYFAIAGALALLITSGYHGFQNRATSPMYKWKRGEI